MTAYVLPLDEPALSVDEAGGKGANLGRLVRAGLLVPPGFVVTCAGYHAYVAANDLAGAIRAEYRFLDPANPDSCQAVSTQIRRHFAQGVIPDHLAKALRQAYARLIRRRGRIPVAVRSSATAEDLPDASFAGQQESFLNVVTEDGLLTALVQCWSSLWTARAIAYRDRRGIPPDDVALAAVVQEMVPAHSAGVLFTMNPLTGNGDQVMINATFGLGEALVSGRVNPDTWVVEKLSGRILSMEVGDKAVMTATMAEGTLEVPVPAGRRNAQVLDAAQAAELARLGVTVENLFGVPQDIEWAIAGATFYLLQARPVTTRALAGEPVVPGDDKWPPLDEEDAQPFDLWTQTDVGERWPEPVTPFTWSSWQPMINENMAGSISALREPHFQRIRWAKRAYGHVYLNEGGLFHAFTAGFGMPGSMIAASLTNMGDLSPHQGSWRWGTVLRRLPNLVWMMMRWERNTRKFEKLFPQLDGWVELFMQRDLRPVSDGDLWTEWMTTWRSRLMHYMEYHGQATSSSMSSYAVMQGLMENWMGQKELVHELIGGLHGVIAAEIVPDLWEIARHIEKEGLRDLLLQNSPRDALSALRRDPSARTVLAQLDSFLVRHGHRCMSEAEWLYPRWREAPEQVVEILAGYLRAGPEYDSTAAEGRQKRLREQAVAQVEAHLDPARRLYFRWSLSRLQRFTRLRDNGQHFLVKLVLPMRRILAVLGERWHGRGWLAEADDSSLVVPEIEAILRAGSPEAASLDVATIVPARRQAYRHWFEVPMPDVLGPDGKPRAISTLTVDPARGEVLQGVAASQGTVQGVARVVLSPQEAYRLEAGEILVTRATDPGWTPVFSIVSGLVLEIGGQLSHGAIVAREYGLPAVVNVPGATQRVRDGQIITVDGTAGRVYLSWSDPG